jgi:hypothetical protein
MRWNALALGLLLFAPLGSASAQVHFGWTLSASPTDPFVNAGPEAATIALYLWFYCSEDSSGLHSTDLAFNCSSVLRIVEFEPRPGVVIESSSPPCGVTLSFTGCPRGSFVVADMVWETVFPSVEICIVPTPQGPDQTFGCDAPTIGGPHAWIGYTTMAKPEPCMNLPTFFDQCESAVSVTTSSWGRIKALYGN